MVDGGGLVEERRRRRGEAGSRGVLRSPFSCVTPKSLWLAAQQAVAAAVLNPGATRRGRIKLASEVFRGLHGRSPTAAERRSVGWLVSAMEPFSYTVTRTLSADDFATANSTAGSSRRTLRRICTGIAGVGCLFWSYTLLLGLALLGLLFLAVSLPRYLPKGLRSNYSLMQHLHEPVTTIVTQDEIRCSGSHYEFWCRWPQLYHWHRNGDWLRLTLHGLPQVYLRVSELAAAGVLSQIEQLYEANGEPFS